MDRVILHADLNNFYASVECLSRPELREKPMAVGGDAQRRHGVVLAKNECAKRFGVQTGEALWLARQKCPELAVAPPHFERYEAFSGLAREIYGEVTDRVESFGIDECWLDVSGSAASLEGGARIANHLRERIRRELGLTISVGVSFNKVFAKLGSDYRKPDAVTEISRENYKNIVWPLGVEQLLYVGGATRRKLARCGVHSIGDLAGADRRLLRNLLGKNGEMLWGFANGLDGAPVAYASERSMVKSIGNSTTTPRDLVRPEEIKVVLYALCESVAARLRERGLLCGTVQVGVRGSDLRTREYQRPLAGATDASGALFAAAWELCRTRHRAGSPIRTLGVRALQLTQAGEEQLSLFSGLGLVERERSLERAKDAVRAKFGPGAIRRGVLLTAPELTPLRFPHSALHGPLGDCEDRN